MKRDERIDAKIAKAAPFAQPILEHLRALVHEAIPEAEEAIKWGMPHFTYKGKNVAGMASFKAHCAFMVHGDGRQGDAMGQFGRIASLDDLPPDTELVAKLKEACARVDAEGTAQKPRRTAKPKPPATVPQDMAAALKANKAASTHFDGFTPSQRREYVEWITEAKQDATRERRLKQVIEWIAEGKHRNWKYEKR